MRVQSNIAGSVPNQIYMLLYRYLASNKTVITISRDPHASLLIRQVENKFDSYIFRLSWGVRCFDYKDCKSVNIIATAR